jgi:hypothetical protein
MLCAALAGQCRQSSSDGPIRTAPRQAVAVESAPGASLVSNGASEIENLARRDPLSFMKHCLAEYDRKIRDYTVTFTKQERLRGKLAAEQETQVRFRQSPYSVDMMWTRNPGRASRVLYVQGARTDKTGRELALIKPAGILGGIGIKVERDIHGPDADVESRRSIDQFGFRKTLELIVKYSEKAAASGELSLEFTGEGSLDGRPTYMFERRLPYTGQDEPYPDKLLVVHVDQEWLLPTGCFSYADDAGQDLLGKYLLTDASFNVGYDAADFDPERMNF